MIIVLWDSSNVFSRIVASWNKIVIKEMRVKSDSLQFVCILLAYGMWRMFMHAKKNERKNIKSYNFFAWIYSQLLGLSKGIIIQWFFILLDLCLGIVKKDLLV